MVSEPATIWTTLIAMGVSCSSASSAQLDYDGCLETKGESCGSFEFDHQCETRDWRGQNSIVLFIPWFRLLRVPRELRGVRRLRGPRLLQTVVVGGQSGTCTHSIIYKGQPIHPVWFIITMDATNVRIVCPLEFPYYMVHATSLI